MKLLHEKDLTQRVLHGSIRCRSSGRDSHNDILVQVLQERFGNNLSIGQSVRNRIVGSDAVGAVNVKGSDTSMDRNLEQMRRIGRIPTPNHENELEAIRFGILHQLVDRILSFLGRVANGIKLHVMLVGIDGSVLGHHCLLQQLSNRSRLLLVHCSLVGQANILQHGVWIKSLGNGLGKVFHERVAVTTILNIVRHHFRFLVVLDANVVFAKADRGDRFLVLVLSVNNRGLSSLLVLVDSVPNLGDPRASSVDDFDILMILE